MKEGGNGLVVVLALFTLFISPHPHLHPHPTNHHPSCPHPTTPGEKWFINSKSSIFESRISKASTERREELSGVECAGRAVQTGGGGGGGEGRGRQSQGVWRARVHFKFLSCQRASVGGGLLLQIRSVHVGTCDMMKLALQLFFFFKTNKKPSLQLIRFIGKCRLVAVIFYFS